MDKQGETATVPYSSIESSASGVASCEYGLVLASSALIVALIPRKMTITSLGVEDRRFRTCSTPPAVLFEIQWLICWLEVTNGTSNGGAASRGSAFAALGLDINSRSRSLARL